MWLSYRCFTAKGQERIAIFGEFGLAAQLGSADYARPRKFRERLERWLDVIRTLWPGCPARIGSNGDHLLIQPAEAVVRKGARMASPSFVPDLARHRRISLAENRCCCFRAPGCYARPGKFATCLFQSSSRDVPGQNCGRLDDDRHRPLLQWS